MNDHVNVVWNIPYLDIPITNVVLMSWIAMAIIILWAFLATRKVKLVPTGLQNSAEIVVQTVNNFAVEFMGSAGKKFAAYLGTIGLFLAISNTIGALFMTEITEGVISPPTRALAVPAALAIMTILIVIGAGIKKKGFIGFLKGLFHPVAFLFPFNLLEFFIKPLSLCMRLYGNILGAFVIMEIIFSKLPWGIPAIACFYFDLFDGGLQAFIFVLLTALYISESIEEEEEE